LGKAISGSTPPGQDLERGTEAVGVSFAPAGQERQSALALDRPSLGQVRAASQDLESDAEPIDVGFTLGEPTTPVLGAYVVGLRSTPLAQRPRPRVIAEHPSLPGPGLVGEHIKTVRPTQGSR
jgi:hypothetical protein